MHVVLKVFHIPRSTYYDWLRCNVITKLMPRKDQITDTSYLTINASISDPVYDTPRILA